MRRALLFLCLMSVFAGVPLAARGDWDDQARRERDDVTEARRRGDILPLAEIFDRLREVTGDQILEVEFEREDGVPVYEIYFVDDLGRRREVLVDARSGAILDRHEED